MTRRTLIILFTLTLVAVHPVQAVWPPSTALEEDVPSTHETAARRTRPASERVEEDIRRLEKALKDLKADQAELKNSAEATSAKPTQEPESFR